MAAPSLIAEDALVLRCALFPTPPMVRRGWTSIAGIGLVALACNSSSSGSSGGMERAGSGNSSEGGDAGIAGESGAAGTTGPEGEAGARDVSGPLGEAGSVGEPEAPGAGGSSDEGAPLPDGTLLYVRHESQDHDLLVARDMQSGDERIITDLTGDGSSGWEIDGFSLSPDRRRIALASLYAPTEADNATGLATRAIWTLSTSGDDFRRLTPTFPKDAQGRQGFQYDVGDPEWTADGSQVLYDFGSYWWEGTDFKGGSFPWIVSATAKAPPTSFLTPTDCTVIYPSRNPVTGELLFIHSVCVPGQGQGEGLYLYPAAGSTRPKLLVSSTHVDGGVDVFLKPGRWFPDGSGFLFLGGTADTNWGASLLAYDFDAQTVSLVAPAPEGTSFYGVAISPDSSKLVYCLRRDKDGAEDLHLIDLAIASPTDVALTTDGKSCDPSF